VAPVSPLAAAAVGAAVAAVVMAVSAPGLLVATVLPASFMTYRAGPLSVADLVLVVVLVAAAATGIVPLADRRLQAALVVAGCYLAVLALVTVASPTTVAVLELGHRAVLVIGAIAVGAAAAQLGVVELSVKLLVLTGAFYATVALLEALALGSPAYPLGVTKNHAGGIMAVGVLILLAEPSIGRRVWLYFFAPLLTAGLLATQSRAGIIALVTGLALLCIRNRAMRRRLLLPIAIGGVLAATTLTSLLQDREIAPEVALSSVVERIGYWEQAIHDWQREPLLGNGLRYYLEPENGFPVPFTDEFPDGAPPHPHNLVVEALAESGIVGTLGLALLAVGTLVVVRRCRGPFALTAEAVVVATLVVGLFDLFWLAGRTVIPFFMVGVATVCAARGAAEARRAEASAERRR
jgi:polysaccharide biosynthesis protein PslJ